MLKRTTRHRASGLKHPSLSSYGTGKVANPKIIPQMDFLCLNFVSKSNYSITIFTVWLKHILREMHCRQYSFVDGVWKKKLLSKITTITGAIRLESWKRISYLWNLFCRWSILFTDEELNILKVTANLEQN